MERDMTAEMRDGRRTGKHTSRTFGQRAAGAPFAIARTAVLVMVAYGLLRILNVDQKPLHLPFGLRLRATPVSITVQTNYIFLMCGIALTGAALTILLSAARRGAITLQRRRATGTDAFGHPQG